jgi:hypothetical protein
VILSTPRQAVLRGQLTENCDGLTFGCGEAEPEGIALARPAQCPPVQGWPSSFFCALSAMKRAWQNNRYDFQIPRGDRRLGAVLRNGSAPAYRPNPARVTFLIGRAGDISKW